ncbi:Vomeronasal type-2 receptor 26 [Cricetulus griseus]|uniref:Vomeronasal type-2 receptor 26 n=1 Tax=Cricetulus griseus TaxID=10029 RepID=G3IAZ5_CRIGR|nr:Vomeronasal type-2 receptor 26 [Cricetulus griseus]
MDTFEQRLVLLHLGKILLFDQGYTFGKDAYEVLRILGQDYYCSSGLQGHCSREKGEVANDIKAPNFIIPICTLIQLGLCGVWLNTSPPFVEPDAYSEHGHIIIVCNKGSTVAFYCVLGYLCFLALGSYSMAYLSMNLPDNEAKLLTFIMLMFFSVCVTFLPVYHSTKGKIMVAMEVFSILASSAGLLGCIFAPKCYIILLRSDKNSLHFIKKNTF